MTTTGEFPVSFVPRSVSDSIDGDNSKEGACTSLSNLIFDPSTPGILQPRPAVEQLNPFTGFDAPGVVSAGDILSGIIYGLVASGLNPGYDQPFAFDISSGDFLPVSGITPDNVPLTQATAGDWIPPDITILGPRIVVVHPGFNFPSGNAFGYFDISGYSESLTGNITTGSPTITGFPVIGALGPGYKLSGTGIPSNTTVVNVSNFSSTTTGDTTATMTTITSVANTVGIAVGQQVVGEGIPTGAVVTAISGSTVTISIAATATASAVEIFFTGTTITMSVNATATTSALTISAAGGQPGEPLWAAGNLMINPLVTKPTTINNFNNRLYFGGENALSWSDTLALTATQSDQTVFIGDGSPITALAPSQLSTLTTAMIQALIVFKEAYIAQVTGDAALSTLTVAAISEEAIGTLSPRSIAVCPDGVRFRAVDGIRIINLSGVVSDPDEDLALPFIYSLYPSRISAGFNNNTYRICCQNGNASGAPFQEYWYDLKRGGWTGPHTFEQDLAIAYNSTFIIFSNTFAPSIWQSDVVQNNTDNFSEVGATNYVTEDGVTPYVAEDGTSQYLSEGTGTVVDYTAEDGITPYITEDGTQNYIAEGISGFPLEFLYETVPMTDFKNPYANTTYNTTLEIAMPSNGNSYEFEADNEIYSTLATAVLTAPPAPAIWGQFTWGQAYWGSTAFGLQPRTIPWPIPLVYNRLSLSVAGTSATGLRLGSFHIISRTLKYLLH